MNFANPHFAEPKWLWLAVLGPLLMGLLFMYAARRRRRAIVQLVAPDRVTELTRSHSPARRLLKQGLLLFGVACMGLAMARPQWGEQAEATLAMGDDILFLLDASKSMMATDVPPNRLTRAKYAILDFVQRHGQGRVGLLVFAGQPFLQCPLTFDYDAFQDSLLSVDINSMPVPGTDVGRALDEAARALEKIKRRKILVLLSDGEDLENNGVQEAKTLATNGVVVFTIGVGTPGGASIPWVAANGATDWLRDKDGNIVRSRLDEKTLQAIAEATQGGYKPLGPVGEGMTQVRRIVESSLELSGAAPKRKLGVDRFHFPVAMVIILLVIESLTGERRRRKSIKRMPLSAAAAVVWLITWLVGGVLYAADTESPTPRDSYNAGTQKLQEGKWREAETLLQKAVSSNVESIQVPALFNLGHVRFKQGLQALRDGPKEEATRPVAQNAEDRAQQAIQYADEALRGNQIATLLAAYRNGRGARKQLKDAMEAIQSAMENFKTVLLRWERASGDFKSAYELRPADAEAKTNSEIVDRYLAALIDQLQMMQSLGRGNEGMKQALSDRLKKIKQRLPKGSLPQGEEEDDEDGDKPKEPKKGMQEQQRKEGGERMMSWEEAMRLLESLKLDGRRVLPMGAEKAGQPVNKSGRDW